MNLMPVIDLLREQIGLAPESLGPTALASSVGARMRALALGTPEAYATRLADDLPEFQALIDHLTVPETWFFRGGDVFQFLARRIAEEIRQRPAGKRYRVLSVPCSTGEEPYSLAIALAEIGVAPERWVIEGDDLSSRSIERARGGIFSEFSFRQMDPELKRRYFRSTPEGWQIQQSLLSQVAFEQGNILAPFFLAAKEPFDLVFCRNLLIYLTPAARQRTLDVLDRLLAKQGLLCMGHAEPLQFLDGRFEQVGPQGHFLYQRKPPVRPQIPAVAERPRLANVSQRESVALAAPSAPVPVDLVAQARELADKGKIDEALASCQANLAHTRSSPHLLSLMGVLHVARLETDEAVRCFQQALYLDPGHRDALTHMMLICQEQGDHAQAARLRRRLERATAGGDA